MGGRNDRPGQGRGDCKPVSGEFQILLIDDHESDAKLFEQALCQASPRVKLYWVSSAQEGLDFLRKQGRFVGVGGPRLVVCDLNMPEMDGFDFLIQARKNPAAMPTPIVIFSSSRSPRDVVHCYELGANSFIAKPMSLEAFVSAVGAMVGYWLDVVELPDPALVD